MNAAAPTMEQTVEIWARELTRHQKTIREQRAEIAALKAELKALRADRELTGETFHTKETQ